MQGIVVDLEWDPAVPEAGILCIGFGSKSLPPKVIRPRLLSNEEHQILEKHPMIEFTKSDAVKLLDHGYEVNEVVDLQVMAWLLDENQPLDLESVYFKYTGKKMDKRLLRTKKRVLFRMNNGKYVPIYRAPRGQLHLYCKRDVLAEMDLFEVLRDQLDDYGLLDHFITEEIPFTRLLVDMDRTGLPIDITASEALRTTMELEHDTLETDLREMAGAPHIFNLASPEQVRSFLFGNEVHVKGKIRLDDPVPEQFWPDETKRGRIWQYGVWVWSSLELEEGDHSEKTDEASVSREALLLNDATREHPWVEKYLEWQKMHKLLTTYLRRFPEVVRDGRIHSQFKQTGTRTGRLSSVNINLQNIPSRGPRGKLIRGLFVAPKELPFLMGDYSQLETRLMAHFSQDPELLRIFRDREDPFIALGSKIYGKPLTKDSPERTSTKNVWYANGYGALPPKMWRMITLDGVKITLSEVEGLWSELQKLVPVYFEYTAALIEQAKVDGYVKTIGGRKRRIRFTKNMTWKEETHGERAAGNARFQGSAHDIMRRTMLGYERPAVRLCAQVHDELIYQYRWECDPAQREWDAVQLSDVAERGHGYDLTVPLVFEAKIATSWADK
jgi:DNA polymerase I